MPTQRSDNRFSGRAMLLGVLAIVTALPGCVSSEVRQRREEARQRAASAAEKGPAVQEYRLRPGDAISVKFFYNPELNDQFTIRPDGRIAMQLIGEVDAAGLAPADLREELVTRYEPHLKDAEVTVNIESYGSRVAYVGGQVREPGVIPLKPGMTALQAVFAAGGDLETAEMRNVVVVRDTGDGEPTFMMVDLEGGLRSLTGLDDLPLRSKDIVMVPRSAVSEAGLWVRQHINELLPLTKTFNVTYQFGSVGIE